MALYFRRESMPPSGGTKNPLRNTQEEKRAQTPKLKKKKA